MGCRKLCVGFKASNVIGAVTLTAPPAMSRSTRKPIGVSFKMPSLPEKLKEHKKERKRIRQRQRGPPAKRGAAACLQTLRANEGNDDDSDDDDGPPPLHVFSTLKPCKPRTTRAQSRRGQNCRRTSTRPFQGRTLPERFSRMGRHPDPGRHPPSQSHCAQFSRVRRVLPGEPISF